MKTIIQKDLFARGKEYFGKSELEYLVFDLSEEAKMLEAQKETGARCFIIGAEKYSDTFYNSIEPGSLVIRFGVGYDSVPLAICKKRGIGVAYTPGTLDRSVAEHTIALLLNISRQITEAFSVIKEGEWGMPPGLELNGKVLAIIGFGNIGRETARIAKNGFGMKIRALGRREKLAEEDLPLVDMYTTDFAEVAAGADFVSLHMGVNEQTRGYIDYNKLKMMEKEAYLINTSRGQLIAEADLYRALQEELIKGAALDVFANEPYIPTGEYDFRELDNVLLTPHIASNTDESNRRMAEMCIANAWNFYQNNLDEVRYVPESL